MSAGAARRHGVHSVMTRSMSPLGALRPGRFCACCSFCPCEPALAQPFGMARGAAPEPGGFTGWILAEQARFYLTLARLLRAAKADGSAAYTLLGVSFIYGIFHAAGPGHGKAVISSYLVANDETWRRGVILSFISAIIQSLVAIAIVGVAAVLLGATAKAMGSTVRIIETVELRADRADRPAAVVGQGPLVPAVAAGAAARRRPRSRARPCHDHAQCSAHASCARSRPRPRAWSSRHHDHGAEEAPAWGHAHGARTAGTQRHRIGSAAGCRRSSPSACARVRARSSCWFSRWRRACSGSASPRPS